MQASLSLSWQDKPPVARNQAPVAGAIRWSRSLFARCKRTHVLLSGMEPTLLQESSGRQARTPNRL